MFPRIALAVLLIGLLAASANAQKDKPKPTKPAADLLTWETVAADKASKLTTKRAQVPGGWLVVVQTGDDMSLTFFPDPGHRWDDKSPSDTKPATPKAEDITKATLERVYQAELEQARATAEVERAKALAAKKKLEEELQKLRAELEKTKKAKKPKKDEKGDKEAERQRISEALGLASREEAQKAKAIAEEARAAAVAEREKAEAVQKKLAETATNLAEAINQRKKCEEAKVAAELCLKVAEVARREALEQKQKAEAVAKDFQKEALVLRETLGAVAKEFQKKLADTTKALEITRASEKRNAAVAANAEAESQRLKAENDLLKKEAERLKQLLDKKEVSTQGRAVLPLHQCEQTIQKIVDEYQQQPTPALKTTILLKWRKKLAQEPARLPVHDIDWLMQEVQRRLKASSR